MIIARECRGLLEDSLKTTRLFDTKEQLIEYYTKMWSFEGIKPVISISDVIGYDARIEWKNVRYILCDGMAVGWCDYDYNVVPEKDIGGK